MRISLPTIIGFSLVLRKPALPCFGCEPRYRGHPVTFARELRKELLSSQVRDEVVQRLGHYLRRMLRGPVLQELNRKIANISALEMKVRAGTMTFSDYEEALHRCIPVGTEAVLIRQTCSFLRRPRERLSDAFHRFEGSVRDLGALSIPLSRAAQFWPELLGVLRPALRRGA